MLLRASAVLWQLAGLVFATTSTPKAAGNPCPRAECSSASLDLLASTGTIPTLNEQTIVLLPSLGMAAVADKSCIFVFLLSWCLLFGWRYCRA